MIRKANRMIFPFRHDARMPGKQDALAHVDNVLPFVARADSAVLVRPVCRSLPKGFPVDTALAFLVQKVLRLRDVAEVGYSIIRLLAVDVVNRVWSLTMNKEPSKSMSEILAPFDADTGVSVTAGICNGGASFTREQSSIGIVAKDIADRIRYKFRSHSELLLSVVRGAVVGATVAPILTWEMSLAK